MPDNAFLGMRGTGDWATDQRPKSWRELILFLYPNGSVPLTAIMSKMKEEKVTDPQYYWWTKKLPEQAGAVTNVYTNSGLSALYSATYPNGGTGAAAGFTVYVKMAELAASEFRVGHQALMRCLTDSYLDVNGKVTARTLAGANSYLTVKLLEADDNSFGKFGAQGRTLAACNRIMVVGNINEEGAVMPGSLGYNPVKYFNYTQIFRTPLSITRTARETRLRTGDAYKEMKREALELHGIEMEKALIFGIPTENAGGSSDQKPERTTQGIASFIKAYVAANFDDYRLNSGYAGKAWDAADGGEAWLDYFLEQVFRFGSAEKLALCGSGALLGLNQLARSGGHINLEPRAAAYGIKVIEWITPFGSIYLKTHPLMSQEVTTRNAMILLEPKNLVYRFITDTIFFGEGEAKQAGPGTNSGRKDATNEEFLTECGLELWHPDTFMMLDGVGKNSAV
ncbi:MAG: DUF5309 family protein [bacterium]|nr:DUF5309 family protein [bacterium]